MIHITNHKQFEEQLTKAVRGITTAVSEELQVKAGQEMGKVTSRFKGHDSSIVAGRTDLLRLDDSRRFVFKYIIIPITNTRVIEVLKDSRDNPHGGEFLYREEDPEWFEFNNIIGNRVRIRESTESGSKPPLGSKERDFMTRTTEEMRVGLRRGVLPYIKS